MYLETYTRNFMQTSHNNGFDEHSFLFPYHMMMKHDDDDLVGCRVQLMWGWFMTEAS